LSEPGTGLLSANRDGVFEPLWFTATPLEWHTTTGTVGAGTVVVVDGGGAALPPVVVEVVVDVVAELGWAWWCAVWWWSCAGRVEPMAARGELDELQADKSRQARRKGTAHSARRAFAAADTLASFNVPPQGTGNGSGARPTHCTVSG
jgi:hypothetical protein